MQHVVTTTYIKSTYGYEPMNETHFKKMGELYVKGEKVEEMKAAYNACVKAYLVESFQYMGNILPLMESVEFIDRENTKQALFTFQQLEKLKEGPALNELSEQVAMWKENFSENTLESWLPVHVPKPKALPKKEKKDEVMKETEVEDILAELNLGSRASKKEENEKLKAQLQKHPKWASLNGKKKEELLEIAKKLLKEDCEVDNKSPVLQIKKAILTSKLLNKK